MDARMPWIACLLAAALSSCGDEQECIATSTTGTQALFDPTLQPRETEPQSWLAYPFPSDHRRTESGSTSWLDFPNPPNPSIVLSKYLLLAEDQLLGFGQSSAVHIAFDGAIDTGGLPDDPAAYLLTDAPLQLVDISSGSPEYGMRRPLRWEYWQTAGRYVPANSLAIAPEWGFPLRESTTYALVLTRDLGGLDGVPLAQPPLLTALLKPDGSPPACTQGAAQSAPSAKLRQLFAPLRALLDEEGIAHDTLAVATVFTTQFATFDLAAIYAQLNEEMDAPAYENDGWQKIGPSGELYQQRSFQWNSTETVDYYVMEGRFTSPNYQVGEVPYDTQGGFNFEGLAPKPFRLEHLRFVLTLPVAPPKDGSPCYPIVEYSHGTGGSAYSFSSGTAGRLAARGLAGISIDQPMHGSRDNGASFDVDLSTFNFLNPLSARTVSRQSAVDTFALTRFVRESLQVPAEVLPSGEAVCFDRDRVSFFGHSQGGISGPIAAGIEKNIGAWVFSGGGGGLAITVRERSDIIDIAEAIRFALSFGAGEELTELHPVMTVIQSLVETTDPLNYAPYWVRLPTYAPPRSFFVTSGHHDVASPHRGATAMAVAARIPIVEPVALPVPTFGYAGLEPVAAPVRKNFGDHTAGFMQWTNDLPGDNMDSHFVIFNRPEAINAAMRFLEAAAYEGSAILVREPQADVR